MTSIKPHPYRFYFIASFNFHLTTQTHGICVVDTDMYSTSENFCSPESQERKSPHLDSFQVAVSRFGNCSEKMAILMLSPHSLSFVVFRCWWCTQISTPVMISERNIYRSIGSTFSKDGSSIYTSKHRNLSSSNSAMFLKPVEKWPLTWSIIRKWCFQTDSCDMPTIWTIERTPYLSCIIRFSIYWFNSLAVTFMNLLGLQLFCWCVRL